MELENMLEGFVNRLKSDLNIANPEIEKIANQRMAICIICEFRIENKCGKCGCPFANKTRSTKTNCPINKW